MKLLTEELLQQFVKVGIQENVNDPVVIAKYFHASGPMTWFMTDYDKESQIFYGYFSTFGVLKGRWSHISLVDLECSKGNYGCEVELDLYFVEKPISELVYRLRN